MNTQDTEEVNETVRSILKQATIYLDDSAIHLTSNPPTSMIDLRMVLARRGLDLLKELPELGAEIDRDPNLTRKRDNLEVRYAELEEKIAKAKTVPGGKEATSWTTPSLEAFLGEHEDNEEGEDEEGI